MNANFWDRMKVALFGHNDRYNIRQVRDKLSKRPQFDSESFANTYFPEEKRAVARKLWEITKEHSVADITGVAPDDEFVEDLKMDDLDSMSLVELAVQIEKEFGIVLSDERLAEMRTFNDLVDEICRLKGDGIVRDPSTSSG
ncbi:MAG: acyl carrier protein [Methylacidiphilales bacterium]|nr:acyl carrier protein [Candidatus Methylacidiphilales bacterium]